MSLGGLSGPSPSISPATSHSGVFGIDATLTNQLDVARTQKYRENRTCDCEAGSVRLSAVDMQIASCAMWVIKCDRLAKFMSRDSFIG